MINELKIELNKTETTNGAVTYKSTGSDCLDLFASIGAMRNSSYNDVLDKFARAYIENPDVAMKILFYTRDIRGGLGERKIFRCISSWLTTTHKESIRKNLQYISEYGRYDDLLIFLHTDLEEDVLKIIKNQLDKDMENLEANKDVSLLGKWLPSVNASNAETIANAKYICKKLNFKEKDYRKMLSALRKKIDIVESHLTNKDYSFEYSEVPSKANLKYRYAFIRNDEIRYNNFLEAVAEGEEKINTSTLYPYEIIDKLRFGCNDSDIKALDTMWNNLPYIETDKNAIAVIDGSGSMYTGCPYAISIAISLGLYFAEHNKGEFKNHFITFSRTPQLIEIKGANIKEKVDYISTFDEVANTDIEAVFDLILNTAVKNNMTQMDLPSTIYIMSDMEFDDCTDNADLTNFEVAKEKFQNAGYTLPNIVFWNVNVIKEQQPVTKNEVGVALVSGCSPNLFSQAMRNDLDPYSFMLEVIGSERYKVIQS